MDNLFTINVKVGSLYHHLVCKCGLVYKLKAIDKDNQMTNNTINKEEALKRLAELKAKTAELEAIINKPDTPINPVFVPALSEEWAFISHNTQRGMYGYTTSARYPTAAAAFRTLEAARAYGEAFQVMLELRAQPGVVQYKLGDAQNLILYSSKPNALYVSCIVTDIKFDRFSPSFDNIFDAQEAIKVVGEDRIIKAMKTLAWSE